MTIRGAYTGPWTTTFNLRRENGQELFEYVCQQANYAGELMVGDKTSVDRKTDDRSVGATHASPLPSDRL